MDPNRTFTPAPASALLVAGLLALPGCTAPCANGLLPVQGECPGEGAATAADSADPASSGPTVLFSETFSGDMADWDLTDKVNGSAECDLDDEPDYRMSIWLPESDQVPYCYLRLLPTFDLRDYEDAWIELDYDVSHYDRQDGPEDAAAIFFDANDGFDDQWTGLSWSRTEGEDAAREGTARADLSSFAGRSAALEVYVRLALFSCADRSIFDCGYRGSGDAAWITVDNFSLVAQ